MNGKSNSDKKQGAGSSTGSSSKGALILGALGVVGLIVVIAVFNSGSPPNTPTQNPNAATADSQATGAKSGTKSGSTSGDEKDAQFGAVNPDGGKSAKAVVDDIVSVATKTNEITADDAKKFHDGLTELVRQGAASVPSIQDYLDKNVDSNYGDVKGAEELGYSSLRHALLDTLKQIGGPESEQAEVHVLQTTAEPNEVGELAKNLEAQAPGQYRDQILQAAKEALDLAESGQTEVERGPLYRVFSSFGASYAPPGQQATPTPTEPAAADAIPAESEHAHDVPRTEPPSLQRTGE